MTKIMCMGDSITMGQAGGYRAFLANHLKADGVSATFVGGQKDDTGCHEGYPGFSIPHLLEGRTSENYGTAQKISVTLNKHQPDVLLLMAGTNDMYFAEPSIAFAALKALIDRSLATLPKLNLMVASILPVKPGPKPWGATIPEDVTTRIPEFNGMIAGYVTALNDSGKRAHFVDIYRTVTSTDELGPDGVHPQAPVFTVMADTWFTTLTSCL